jgi:hypothetical protein
MNYASGTSMIVPTSVWQHAKAAEDAGLDKIIVIKRGKDLISIPILDATG